MNKIYVTSDTHFGHDRQFIYEPRGFKNIQEHDETIINNWNKVIDNDDMVYLLGDVMLNDNKHGIECLNRLNGKIHIILGNHCTDTRRKFYEEAHNVLSVQYATVIKYKGYHFYLSHYPTLTSNLDDDKPLKTRSICLCGHSHYKNKFKDMDKGLIFHCELDTNNCYPWSIDEIIKEIKTFISLDDNAKKELSESDI